MEKKMISATSSSSSSSLPSHEEEKFTVNALVHEHVSMIKKEERNDANDRQGVGSWARTAPCVQQPSGDALRAELDFKEAIIERESALVVERETARRRKEAVARSEKVLEAKREAARSRQLVPDAVKRLERYEKQKGADEKKPRTRLNAVFSKKREERRAKHLSPPPVPKHLISRIERQRTYYRSSA